MFHFIHQFTGMSVTEAKQKIMEKAKVCITLFRRSVYVVFILCIIVN